MCNQYYYLIRYIRLQNVSAITHHQVTKKIKNCMQTYRNKSEEILYNIYYINNSYICVCVLPKKIHLFHL